MNEDCTYEMEASSYFEQVETHNNSQVSNESDDVIDSEFVESPQ